LTTRAVTDDVGQYGYDDQSFSLPTGIDVGTDGSIYVADTDGSE